MAGTIWLANEDLSFQKSGTPPVVFTGAGTFRSEYNVRCSLQQPFADYAEGNQFSDGAVTTAWTSAWGDYNDKYNLGGFWGVRQHGTPCALLVGTSTANNLPGKVALFTWDGTTLVKLDEETGTSLGIDLFKIDMQIVNYGATATVKVYVNGAPTPAITFTGNVTVGDMTAFDCMVIAPYSAGNTGFSVYLSEFMVDTRDTRTMILATDVGTGAGGTDAWTGSYSDCNPVTINDANAVYTETASEDEQFAATGPPSGSFTVLAVLEAARACITEGSPIETLRLGWHAYGFVGVDAGHTLTTAWDCYENLAQLSPFSALPWTLTDIENIQEDLQSAA